MSKLFATNIDYGLLVQAVDRDLSLNRLERYLTICHASHVEPIIVLSKVDLIAPAELHKIIDHLKERIRDLPIIPVSMHSIGYEPLQDLLQKGKTYCLLGSSGVGKSTILNHLLGKQQMKTSEISSSVGKGKHTTSHRELFVLDSGGMLIDNPGMREVGIADTARGLETTFESILAYAEDCRFKDCTHTHEKGCAVLKALEEGAIDPDSYANFRKMEKEKAHFEANIHERRQKDRSQGKLYKKIQQQRRNQKY